MCIRDRYYIANVDDMKSDSIQNWLLSTLSVSNSLLENKSVSYTHLDVYKRQMLHFTHQSKELQTDTVLKATRVKTIALLFMLLLLSLIHI